MDIELIREIVREELLKIEEERAVAKKKPLGLEFRVCYEDKGGSILAKRTFKEEEAIFYKMYFEAQGKQAEIKLWDGWREQHFDYDDYKKQREK